MLAYHNDPAIKSKLLADLQAHADADRLVKGQYWESGKGCAVGCTLHSVGADGTAENHSEYETRLGIPQMLAQLEDAIFEGLHNADAMQWPMRFSAAIATGADLSRVGWQWLHWLLTDGLPRVNDVAATATIKQCADILLPLTRGEPVDGAAADAAARAANAAADVAAYAGYTAARAAAYAADAAAYAANAAARAADAARAAVRAAARAADAAADAAARAADAAARAADAAARAAAYAAYTAARAAVDEAAYATDAAYARMADKLVQLLEDAK
jgi:hypothetical protein